MNNPFFYRNFDIKIIFKSAIEIVVWFETSKLYTNSTRIYPMNKIKSCISNYFLKQSKFIQIALNMIILTTNSLRFRHSNDWRLPI